MENEYLNSDTTHSMQCVFWQQQPVCVLAAATGVCFGSDWCSILVSDSVHFEQCVFFSWLAYDCAIEALDNIPM
jgi:hypothetical protein